MRKIYRRWKDREYLRALRTQAQRRRVTGKARLVQESVHNNSVLPQKTGVYNSVPMFWEFFDWLPKEERERVNYANSRPHVEQVWSGVVDRHFAKFTQEKNS